MLTHDCPLSLHFVFFAKKRKAERKDGILVFDWIFDSGSIGDGWLQLNASQLVEPGTTSSSGNGMSRRMLYHIRAEPHSTGPEGEGTFTQRRRSNSVQ